MSQTGRVKWFSNDKGFGFIEREDDEDVFVHYSEIAMDGFRTLDEGEKVEFEVIQGDRGPKARDVKRLGMNGAAKSNRGTSDADTGPEAAVEPTAEGGSNGHGHASLTLVEQIKRKLGGRFFG